MILGIRNPFDFINLNSNDDIPINPNNNIEEIPIRESINQKNEINSHPSFSSNCEKCIEKGFKLMTLFLQCLGPMFTYSIVLFFLFVYISIIKSIIPEYEKEKGLIISRIILFCCSIETFYIIFNFLLATLIKPGSVSDIINSKYYKNHNPYISKSLILPQITLRLNDNNSNSIWKRCKYCKIIKPLRTHHCAICNNCIFKMDHHCPWINNCVGQNNQRYFLLFLTHCFIYDIIVVFCNIPLLFKGYFYKLENQFQFLCILSFTSFIILFFFNSWNWFLALNGYTTIEFWGEKSGHIIEKFGPVSYNFGNWKKNIFSVFGSDNLFFIIFVPNIRKLPYSGLEWSKYIDDNFEVEGIENIKENNEEIEINVSI